MPIQIYHNHFSSYQEALYGDSRPRVSLGHYTNTKAFSHYYSHQPCARLETFFRWRIHSHKAKGPPLV